jgi:hypothetical protein
MPSYSRCVTVHPAATPREGFSVLVIDRTLGEAERVCAKLRKDGHLAQAYTYDDDLERIIDEQKPQALAIRMRIGSGSRGARSRIQRLFPHLLVVTFNADTADTVGEQLPTRWTDLYELAAAPIPPLYGFPRALREAFEATLRVAS